MASTVTLDRGSGSMSGPAHGWRTRLSRAWTRRWHWVTHLPPLPTGLAVVGYLAAGTPSLLPRPFYFQGLIGGIAAMIFYIIGLGLRAVWRMFARWSGFSLTIRGHARRVMRIVWTVLVVLVLVVYALLNFVWRYQVSAYVGEEPPGLLYPLGSLVMAVAVFALFVGVWLLVRMLVHWMTGRMLRQRVREQFAHVAATVVTLVLIAGVLDQVVIRGLLDLAKDQAEAANARTPLGAFAPASPLRSGGPGSLVRWDDIGADGKTFVSSGPSAAQLSRVLAKDATAPIRLFAGVSNRIATEASTQAALEQAKTTLLAEMDRTKAWDRKAILVITSTSTGFVNEWAAESFEYLMEGDCAIVTLQYSTLPSALGLITARNEPPRVGKLLFDAVHERVADRPQATRPRLFASGESLGAYGGNGAYDSPDDMLAKVDGALWTGTPSFTQMHEELTDSRSFGSTTVNPTVDNGKHIRFAGNVSQLTHDQFGHELGPWEWPRVAYLQHESDPVVWWSTNLLFTTPSWLAETQNPGQPMSRMSWRPIVTFWQLTADLAMSNTVPGGFGHRYFEGETVPAWAGVLGRDPTADYSAIQAAIHRDNPG